MSRDLIVFDPNGLDGMSGDRTEIVKSVNRYLLENEREHDAPEPAATDPIRTFLDSVSGRYLAAYLDANGRYCNINRPGETDDWENTVMAFSEWARTAGLILIDPQGTEPLMTAPNGVGLLDT